MLASMLLAIAVSQTPPSAGPVVEAKEAPAYKILKGKGTARLYLNATNGYKDAAISVLTLDKNAEVPEHAHDTSDEALYIVKGAIDMVVGGKSVHGKVGDVMFIPRNTKHSAKATEKTEAVQVYTPPGPEQRFASGERMKE